MLPFAIDESVAASCIHSFRESVIRSSFPGEPSSSEEEPSDDCELDKGSILQLPQKEFSRGSKQRNLDDLSHRQMSYVIAGLHGCLPSDLVEAGGECVIWMQIRIRQGE